MKAFVAFVATIVLKLIFDEIYWTLTKKIVCWTAGVLVTFAGYCIINAVEELPFVWNCLIFTVVFALLSNCVFIPKIKKNKEDVSEEE